MNNWDDSLSAKVVLNWASRRHTDAVAKNVAARCEEHGRLAKKKAWAEYNPDDGVGCPSSNPYLDRRDLGAKLVQDTAIDAQELGYVLDFVTERICEMVVEKECEDADNQDEKRP